MSAATSVVQIKSGYLYDGSSSVTSIVPGIPDLHHAAPFNCAGPVQDYYVPLEYKALTIPYTGFRPDMVSDPWLGDSEDPACCKVKGKPEPQTHSSSRDRSRTLDRDKIPIMMHQRGVT
jgi:hypothetical protein